MKFRSQSFKHRQGRETTAISIGLFVFSLCVVAGVFVWFGRSGKSIQESDTYSFVKPELDAPDILTWHHVDDFPAAIAQMESVFWEPDDTSSLRSWLKASDQLKNASVLEIGCGTGLVSIACALQGARRVVASDINPAAVVNATYNAELCKVSQQLKVRQVNPEHPGPFEVIAADEKFDFIVSNPPWEDAPVDSPAAYAFYDPGFKLLEGILAESKKHLQANGRVLLAYGAKRAIHRIQEIGPKHGWKVTIQDSRNLESLPEVFLPGMLLELKPVEPEK
jgi:release factor glutamine methyltransferase